MLLSIIIPIYRVEDTIQRCLESVLMQLDDRMELIIIDDGSPDDSAKIASRMIQGRANCTLIHQSNQGLSAARKTGPGGGTGLDFYLEGQMVWTSRSKIQLLR